jgi:hypothetical protein
MNTVVEVSNGMSIMNECYDCITIADYDVKCRVCDESDEARVDELAWNHRADERLAEGDVITDLSTPPSASDWIGSNTRQADGRIRNEFVPATYNLADRCPGTYFLGKHLFDLDDDEKRSVIHFYEVVCPSCNLVWPKRTGCQECKVTT